MDASASPPISPQSEAEAQFLAQALDYFRAVKQAGNNAPYGQFLNHAEKAVMEQGRELLRQSLESITQEAIDEVEKKKKPGTALNVKQNENIAAIAKKTSEPPPER